MVDINWSELTLDEISHWPVKAKKLVIVFICCLVSMICYWWLLQEPFAYLSELHWQLDDLQQTFKHHQQAITQLPIEQNQLKKLQLHPSLAHFHSYEDIDKLLAAISHIGLLNNLQFKTFKPLPEQNENAFLVQPIYLDVIGNYQQLVHFTNSIMALSPVIKFVSFNLAALEMHDKAITSDKLILSLILENYVVKNALQDADGVVANNGQKINHSTNPFKAKITLQQQNYQTESLTLFPFQSLRLVGTIKQGEQYWALLAAPNGHIYRITKGMELADGVHVLAVMKDKLEAKQILVGNTKQQNQHLFLTLEKD